MKDECLPNCYSIEVAWKIKWLLIISFQVSVTNSPHLVKTIYMTHMLQYISIVKLQYTPSVCQALSFCYHIILRLEECISKKPQLIQSTAGHPKPNKQTITAADKSQIDAPKAKCSLTSSPFKVAVSLGAVAKGRRSEQSQISSNSNRLQKWFIKTNCNYHQVSSKDYQPAAKFDEKLRMIW